MKKTLSVILALVMSFLMIPVSVLAADVGSVPSEYTPSPSALPVSTVDEFEAMGNGNEYYLTNNIDFGGKKYTTYIAEKADFRLDGCGFSIKNFSFEGTLIAMYKEPLSGTSVKNLVIGSVDSPINVSGNSNLGCMYTQIVQPTVVENVKIFTNISTTGNAGAIAPYVSISAECVIKNCEVNGSVTGKDAGGLFGHIKRATKAFVLDGCTNNAGVTGAEAGGIVGYLRTPLNITNCVNNGTIVTNGNYAGGILGGFGFTSDLSLNFIGCSNYGSVVGNKTGKIGSDYSKDINIDGGVGGILGASNTFVYEYSTKINIDKCMNYGTITTNGLSAGAIMGKGVAAKDGYASHIIIKNCGNIGTVNYGDIVTPVGSLVSAVSTEQTSSIIISNCFNAGLSNSPKALAGVYNLNGEPSKSDASVSDLYYLLGNFTEVANTLNVKVRNSVACTDEQFASGEVAFSLGNAFGQKLKVDSYPVANGPVVVQVDGEYVNINTISAGADGSAMPYIQETEAVAGKQSVRFVIAVDSDNIDSAATVEMTIVFKKTGEQDILYTLENGNVKLFKSVVADSVVYMGDNGVVLLGAAVDGVVASEWDSTSIVLTVKDESGAAISELCVSATYIK